MSQDYARPQDTPIKLADTPGVDAFSRLRTSTPTTLFDAQLTYGLQPILFEPITNGSGASIAHDATNRCALLTFSSTPTGGKAYMQTYEHVRYQPSKSQLVFVTFNFIAGVANVLKFAGLSDGTNGFELQLDGTTLKAAIYSATSAGNQIVAQSAWNLDKLDGTGSSGLTLDVTKTQILVIDFQALYVGRVRMGVDIQGRIIYFHQFLNANVIAVPYIQTANLPVRCGMTCTGTVSTTMRYVCSAVVSEGGVDDSMGFAFSTSGTITAGNGTDTHILSIQPKLTFNSIVNREKIVLTSVDVLVEGANPIIFKLCIGQVLTAPVFADVNTTYSGVQVLSGAGTLSGTPAIVFLEGFINSGASAKNSFAFPVWNRYPITLDAAGAVRTMGRITGLVQGITGTSASRMIFNWKEIR